MNHPFARSVRLSTSHALRVVAGRTAHGVCRLLWGLCAGVSLRVGCAVGMGQSSTGSDLKSIPVKEPERGEKVSYSRQIAELLENKCTGCHGSVLAEKRLSLESVAGMLKGGKSGPAIVPGKADESLLFKMAAHRVQPVMPPKDKPANKPMTSLELGLLKLWIDAGAADDSDEAEIPKNRAPRSDRAGRSAAGRAADQRGRHDRRRCSGRGRPGQRRAGLRRRLGPGDRLAGRPQRPDPVRAIQPRRDAPGSGQLPDRHALDGPDGKSGEEPGGPRRSGAVNGGSARRRSPATREARTRRSGSGTLPRASCCER